MEAVGGTEFGRKELRHAERTFWKYQKLFGDKNNVLYQINEELAFLQELDDYEPLKEGLKTNWSWEKRKEKAMELAYMGQKKGEFWIQSTTALAIMERDGYLTADGKLTEKYKNADQKEKEELSDKISQVNNRIHGRYSTKEASTAMQSVWWRVGMQFRKYLPAAVESRFGKRRADVRLGHEVEGRYRTAFRVIGKELLNKHYSQAIENLLLPLYSYKKALEKGNLTEFEIANIRKNLAELILAGAMFALYSYIHGGDDEEKRKRRSQQHLLSLFLASCHLRLLLGLG